MASRLVGSYSSAIWNWRAARQDYWSEQQAVRGPRRIQGGQSVRRPVALSPEPGHSGSSNPRLSSLGLRVSFGKRLKDMTRPDRRRPIEAALTRAPVGSAGPGDRRRGNARVRRESCH